MFGWKRIVHEDLVPTDANEKIVDIDAVLAGRAAVAAQSKQQDAAAADSQKD